MITLRDFLLILLTLFAVGTLILSFTHFLIEMQGVSFRTIILTFFAIDFSLIILLLIDLTLRDQDE